VSLELLQVPSVGDDQVAAREESRHAALLVHADHDHRIDAADHARAGDDVTTKTIERPTKTKRRRRFGNIYSRTWRSGRRTWSATWWCATQERKLTRAFDTEKEARDFLAEVEQRLTAEQLDLAERIECGGGATERIALVEMSVSAAHGRTRRRRRFGRVPAEHLLEVVHERLDARIVVVRERRAPHDDNSRTVSRQLTALPLNHACDAMRELGWVVGRLDCARRDSARRGPRDEFVVMAFGREGELEPVRLAPRSAPEMPYRACSRATLEQLCRESGRPEGASAARRGSC
jgi:hypothetical protein